MKTMERNKVGFWYLLYDRKEPVKDEDLFDMASNTKVCAALPAGRRWYCRLPERVRAAATPVLVLGAMVLCTASLVDASYNPFLYFRF